MGLSHKRELWDALAKELKHLCSANNLGSLSICFDTASGKFTVHALDHASNSYAWLGFQRSKAAHLAMNKSLAEVKMKRSET